MATGGGADSSTSAVGPSAAGARAGRTLGRRKRPRSQSSASLDDQGTRLQEEDFTW